MGVISFFVMESQRGQSGHSPFFYKFRLTPTPFKSYIGKSTPTKQDQKEKKLAAGCRELKYLIKLKDYSTAETLTWAVLTVKSYYVRLWKLGENQVWQRCRKP
ncbi:MAG: hypothetical protein ACLP2X_17225, partial [Syntrophobacteraceae bacterium]